MTLLSINNLCLLYVVAEIDSNGREGLSAGKFSLKSKQFFLLTWGLRFRTTKTDEDPVLKAGKLFKEAKITLTSAQGQCQGTSTIEL